MSWTAVAVAGGAVVGSLISSNGAQSAANTQADAANHAAQAQLDMFNKNVELQEPWRQAGIGALGQLTQGTGSGGDYMRDFTAADFQQDPGYQFRMQQGQKGLEASAAARGGLLSGGAGKDLVEYGQNFASGEYQNAYNRFNADRDRRFNRLSSIAGLGQTATRDVTNQGANAANAIGEFGTQAANANAAGQIGQANAINQSIGTLGNLLQYNRPGGANNYSNLNTGTENIKNPSTTAGYSWYDG